VHFVALPQSDLYMMGRPEPNADGELDVGTGASPRGTLNVPQLIRLGFNAAIAVNNVGNAFTPQGAPDPLALCPLGVAVYQDGTVDGCRILLEAVTVRCKEAIGLGPPDRAQPSDLIIVAGMRADLVILHGNESLLSAALSPSFERTTIANGNIVAWRAAQRWTAGQISMDN